MKELKMREKFSHFPFQRFLNTCLIFSIQSEVNSTDTKFTAFVL